MKLMKDENAVSPVIGVILMVAITVVLAAIVFVLVSDLGDIDNSDARMHVITDEIDGNTVLTVMSIDGRINADNLVIKSNGATLSYTLSDAELEAGSTITLDGIHDSFIIIVDGRVIG